jgi:predicted O-methyltransferase YrrM
MPLNDETPITEATIAYVTSVSQRPNPPLDALRADMAGHPRGFMTVFPVQAQLLQVLALAMGAKKALDIGTFTGASSTALAQVLPPDGQVVTLDVSEEYVATARRVWDAASVSGKIELIVGSADASMETLLARGEAGSFDIALLDTSEKKDYGPFYELALKLLRRGGAMVIDNTLYGGRVLPDDPRNQLQTREGEGARALIAFNKMVHADGRVAMAMLTVADGVTIAVKR